jgi:hypothetical protein
MPRINNVHNSRKAHKCGRCHKVIPRGADYRYVTPRYGAKKIRCMEFACRFRPTDLSGAKTTQIEEAIEDAQAAIADATCYEDIQGALAACGEVASEVAAEYQEANDAWAGGQGRDDLQEKIDACESFADDCEGWEFGEDADEGAIRDAAIEGVEREEGESLDDFEQRLQDLSDQAWEDTLQEMRDEADNVLESFEAP